MQYGTIFRMDYFATLCISTEPRHNDLPFSISRYASCEGVVNLSEVQDRMEYGTDRQRKIAVNGQSSACISYPHSRVLL
jgi:hypothetical protein